MTPEEEMRAKRDAMTDEDIAKQIADDPDVAPVLDDLFFEEGEIVRPPMRVQQMVRLDPDLREAYLDPEGRMDNDRINRALRTFADQL